MDVDEGKSLERRVVGTKLNEFGRKVKVVRVKKKKGIQKSQRDNESMLASEI